MIDLGPLVNKVVPFRFRGADLSLELSHALFSSYDIDVGTRLLFKAVGRDERLAAARRILDEGTGVGVIGLALAKAFPEADILARDRDLMACAFAERNRARNKVRNLRVLPGLLAAGSPGGEGAGPFDYILSNVPAKAGGPVIAAFFRAAYGALVPGGRLAIVIVKPLVEEARLRLAEAGFSAVAEERGSMHGVFVAERPEGGGSAAAPAAEGAAPAAPVHGAVGPAADAPPAPLPGELLGLESLGLSVYERNEGQFSVGERRYRARGYYGLPDFDTVGWSARLAASVAERAFAGILLRAALVLEPGAGHFPLWLARGLAPDRVDLGSRDLLALAASKANLASQPRPRPETRCLDLLRLDECPEAAYDALVDFPDPVPEHDGSAAFWDRASRLLKRGGSLVVVASSTEVARLEKRRPEGFSLRLEKRKRGFTGAAYRRE